MDNIQSIIVAQTVLKGFVEANKRLPKSDEEWQVIQDGVYKTWVASENARKKINKVKI